MTLESTEKQQKTCCLLFKEKSECCVLLFWNTDDDMFSVSLSLFLSLRSPHIIRVKHNYCFTNTIL